MCSSEQSGFVLQRSKIKPYSLLIDCELKKSFIVVVNVNQGEPNLSLRFVKNISEQIYALSLVQRRDSRD